MQSGRSSQDWNKLVKEQAVFALYTTVPRATRLKFVSLIITSISAVMLAAVRREKKEYSIALSSKPLPSKMGANGRSGGEYHKMAWGEADVSMCKAAKPLAK